VTDGAGKKPSKTQPPVIVTDQTFRRRHVVQTVLRAAMLLLVVAGPIPFMVYFIRSWWSWSETTSTFLSWLFTTRSRYNDEAGIFVACLILATALRIGERWLLRWLVPAIRPVCPECGYLIRAGASPKCPECGATLPKAMVEPGEQ